MEKVEVTLLILDETLYPRYKLDSQHVRDIAEAMRAGREMPPVIADRESKRVVDGWHRIKAARVLYAEDAEVNVEWREYESEGDMLLDAMRLNSSHGRKLSAWDRDRCFSLGQEYHLDSDLVRGALGMSTDGAAQLRRRHTAMTSRGKPVSIKNTLSHLAGKRLTKKQLEGNERVSGMRPLFYVNQVLYLLRYDLIDPENERLCESLSELQGELAEFLAKRQVEEVVTA